MTGWKYRERPPAAAGGTLALAKAAIPLLGAAAAWAGGRLSVATAPAGAGLWCRAEGGDERFLGETPVEGLDLPAGHYRCRLILGAQDSADLDGVEIREGRATALRHTFTGKYARLAVATEPDSCALYLDEVKLGPAPFRHDLMVPGAYILAARAPDAAYLDAARPLRLSPGDSARIRIRLPFRQESLDRPSLGPRAGAVNLDAGLRGDFTSARGDGDGDGDGSGVAPRPAGWHLPLAFRYGLPGDWNLQAALPAPPRDRPFGAPELGLGYTYAPARVSAALAYVPPTEVLDAGGAVTRFRLSLATLQARGPVQAEATAGYTLAAGHAPDQASGYVQAGYAWKALLPYLGLEAKAGLRYGSKARPWTAWALAPEPGLELFPRPGLAFRAGLPLPWSDHYSGWSIRLACSASAGG